MNYFLNHL